MEKKVHSLKGPKYNHELERQKQLETHCKLIEAIHRYYIEFEYWEIHHNYNSSRRLNYWLHRIRKCVLTRLAEIKKFQTRRDPKFDPEIYKRAYQERMARDQLELEAEIQEVIYNNRRETKAE